MLYRFAWVLMWVTFKIYFRRIDVVGLKKLAQDKPCILIANHPASFLDAMVLAVFLKRNLHFYVRGDIFKHPWVYRFLTWLQMIPIFSREHGIENVGRNIRTFERGKQLLKKGKLLLIFPEGFSRLSKKMEPIKKGTARVALQTAFDDDGIPSLYIQSVAIHYSHHGIKSDLFIRLGESLSLEKYEEVYKEFPAKAIRMLRSDLTCFFERNIIHIQHDFKTQVAEDVLQIGYNDCMDQPENFFHLSRNVCSKLDQKSNGEFEQYHEDVTQYKYLLKKHGLVDRSFSKNQLPLISSLLKVLLTVEIFLFSKIFWFLPGKISKWIADKTVTRIDFYTSVFSGVLAFICFIWWMCWLICVLQSNFFILKISIAAAPCFAYIAMQWEHHFNDLKSELRLKKLKSSSPDLVIQLIDLRNNLLA